MSPALPPKSPTSRADLRAMLGDGVAMSFMLGVGEAYLAAFALALGKGEATAGLVASVPLIAGALLQLAAPRLLRALGSYRRWVVLSATAQALAFVPLVVAALMGSAPTWVLFVTVTLYFAAGLATSPAWNTWVGHLVPARFRARFMALRSRWAQLAVVAGLVAGGLVLHVFESRGLALVGFAVVFGLALIARLASAWFQAQQRDVEVERELEAARVPLRQLLARLVRQESGAGRLLVFMVTLQFGVYIAAPYFSPFMLKPLGLSYVEFMLLVSTQIGTKALLLPLCGRLSNRLGTRGLLWLGGAGIVPLPLMWCFTDAYGVLVVAQMASGAAWAAYELATTLVFLDTLELRERTRVLTVLNVALSMAMVGGSLIGGALLKALGSTHDAYLVVFIVSTVVRLASLVFAVRLRELLRLGIAAAGAGGRS